MNIHIDTVEKLDIEVECGAKFEMPFTMFDDSEEIIDLTGAEIEAQLRQNAESADYFQFTVIHNGIGGHVVVSMPYELTAEISFTSGVYDIYVTFPNEDRKLIMYGDVIVYPNVTKPINGEIMYLLSFTDEDAFPEIGMLRRLYFAHASNKLYKWNGSTYVPLVLSE